jgi:SAM-dependent methyltransferase
MASEPQHGHRNDEPRNEHDQGHGDHSNHDHSNHDHSNRVNGQSGHGQSGHSHGGHRHGGEADPAAAMSEMLDLDAEVLHDYLTELTGWVHRLATDPAPRRILDLGSGTGTGTVALAREFPDARITALDASETLLNQLMTKARDLGLAERIEPVRADLDLAWPPIAPVELVWASASMHHLAEPDRVLADILASLAPGGRLVVVELDSFPSFLPEDLGIGRPGLEARTRAALREEMAVRLPHMGSDWGPALDKAGFAREAERHFTIDLRPPLPAAAGRYALASLSRLRHGVESRLSPEDSATFDALLDPEGPDSVLRRDDLNVRATRTVWIGRKP